MDIKGLSNEEIKKLVIEGRVSNADINDAGICPTCFNEENDYVLLGNSPYLNDSDIINTGKSETHKEKENKKETKEKHEVKKETKAKSEALKTSPALNKNKSKGNYSNLFG